MDDRIDPRVRRMLEAPVVPTVLAMAWPNVLMMVVQSGTGFVEAWFLSRLGTQALAGSALVLPLIMLMQNMSQGAMGGGVSSAIARALGAGRRNEADSLALHAVLIAVALGLGFTLLVLLAGPRLYAFLGGRDRSLAAALAYSNVVFAGIVLMWTMNTLASVVRGTGNMLGPGAVVCGGALLLVPLSPCLIFGIGPLPALGIAGAGAALLAYYGAGTLVLGWYVASGRSSARLRRGALRRERFRSILGVGALATVNSLQTNAMLALSTALVDAYAGTSAVAGYGIAARLEYLVAPLAFGIGAPLVALVGANRGAGQPERARRITAAGGALAFACAGAVGAAAACWPMAWLGLFSSEAAVLRTGTNYLGTVAPFYGFFGMGWALYFASQGARRLKWPLLAGFARLALSVGGGWAVLHFTGSLALFFATAAAAMALYGLVIAAAASSRGGWFPIAAPAHGRD